MATSSSKFCSPCQLKEQLEKSATVWCQECVGFLCKECNNLHDRFSATSEHNTISVDNYLELPQYVLSTNNQCQQHCKKNEFYCSRHAVPCCTMCIPQNHKDCEDIKDLEKAVKTVKSSAAMSNLESDIESLTESFAAAEKAVNDNISSLVTEKDKNFEEIRKIREAINEQLDQMEKTIKDEISLKHRNEVSRLKHQLIEIESRQNIIQQLQVDVDKMKNFATNMQTFHGVQTVGKEVGENISQLEKWKTEKYIRFTHLRFHKPKNKYSLPDSDTVFGATVIDEEESDVNLPSAIKCAVVQVDCPTETRIMNKDIFCIFAIDLGPTRSVTGCSLDCEFDIDPLRIHSPLWTNNFGQSRAFHLPTCVLLDCEKNIVAFGYEAEKMYNELVLDGEENDYSYFPSFMKVLQNEKDLSEICQIKDQSGKEVPAIYVLGLFIKGLRDNLVFRVAEKTEFQMKHFGLVVSIPKFNSLEQFVRASAKQVGIPDDQLLIISKQVAVATLCGYLEEKLMLSAHKQVLQEEGGLLVVDLEDDYIEASLIKLSNNTTCKQIYSERNEECGGSSVNTNFEDFWGKLFGAEVLQDIKEKNPEDYANLMYEFDINRNCGHKHKLTIKVPLGISEIIENYSGESWKELLYKSPFGNSVSFVGDKLRFGQDFFEDLFSTPIQVIIDLIRNVQSVESYGEIRYSVMLLHGRFSESPIVQDAIRTHFADTHVIVPHLAAVNGAVIAGHLTLRQQL